MAYKRRKSETRCCVHCGRAYESNHKRRIYCSSSCNTLAYLARRPKEASALPPPEMTLTDYIPLTPAEVIPYTPPAEPLTFNQTLLAAGIAAIGVGLTGRVVTADERQRKDDVLAQIHRQTSLTGADLTDFIRASLEADPALAKRFWQNRVQRQKQQAAAARINSRKPLRT